LVNHFLFVKHVFDTNLNIVDNYDLNHQITSECFKIVFFM